MKRVKRSRGEIKNVTRCKEKVRLDPSVAVGLLENQILTNPLIVDEIFADISYSDLLNCSLVSKGWNLTCRGILVDRFRTYFTIPDPANSGRLQDFYAVIRNIVPGHIQHPVNGVRIKFDTQVSGWPYFSEPFADTISRIMELLDVKYVSLDMSKLHLRTKTTDFSKIFKTLVMPHLRTLLFLEVLNFDGFGNLKTLSRQLKVDSLPNLKKLNMNWTEDRRGKVDFEFFEGILHACPNLMALPPLLPFQLPALKQTNKLHLASKIRFNYMSLTPNDMQLLQEYSALIKSLEINQHDDQDRNEYKGSSISDLLPLFSSHLRHTLEHFHISLDLLVAILLQKTFPALQNLKELSCQGSQSWFPCLLKNKAARFERFLPNLKSVTLSWTDRDSSSRWLQRQCGAEGSNRAPISLFMCKSPGSLDSVTALKLCKPRPDDGMCESLMMLLDLDQVFPCVTRLDIQISISEPQNLLRWICESWGDLLQVLVLRRTKCLGFHPDPPGVLPHEWQTLLSIKRKPLPSGAMYPKKLSQLRRLELEFWHPKERDSAGNYVDERAGVRGTFDPSSGGKVHLVIKGCRAEKRMKIFKSGLNIFDNILAVHSCPRNLELSVMEEIIATKSICTNLCKMLPTPDLLRCYRVNRNWSAVARDELHEVRPCTLALRPMYFGDFDNRRHVTRRLEESGKLFNTLRLLGCPRIISQHGNREVLATAEAATQFLKNSDFNRTTFLHFRELQVSGLEEDYSRHERSKSNHSVLVRMRAKVMKLTNTLLAKLELKNIQTLVGPIENFDELFRDAKGKLLVPNLKSIKFVDPEKLPEHCQVFKRLLVDLDSLERIDVPFSNKLLPLVSSAGRAHCVKHIQIYNSPEKELFLPGSILSQAGESETEMALEDPRTALGSLLKFAKQELPLIETVFVGDSVALGQENESVFHKLFHVLCTSSYGTLRRLHLSLSFLNLISKVYSRPLVTLKKLELLFVKSDSDQRFHKIPLSHMTPNLEAIELTRSTMYFIGVENLGAERKPGPSALSPCASVKSLKFTLSLGDKTSEDPICSLGLEPWNIGYIAGVFPQVTNFVFSNIDSSTAQSGKNVFFKMLGLVWKSWPNLKSLKLYSSSELDPISFETWLLGISTAEWTLWKEILENELITPDLLDSMHYAPSTFSVRNCKNLKELWISGSIKTRILGRTFLKDPTWDRIQLLPCPEYTQARND